MFSLFIEFHFKDFKVSIQGLDFFIQINNWRLLGRFQPAPQLRPGQSCRRYLPLQFRLTSTCPIWDLPVYPHPSLAAVCHLVRASTCSVCLRGFPVARRAGNRGKLKQPDSLGTQQPRLLGNLAGIGRRTRRFAIWDVPTVGGVVEQTWASTCTRTASRIRIEVFSGCCCWLCARQSRPASRGDKTGRSRTTARCWSLICSLIF